MNWNGKKVLVFGTGISGIGAGRLLESLGADLILFDENRERSAEAIREKLEKKSRAHIVIGDLPDETLNSLDLAVLSPGVPTDLPLVQTLRDAGIPVWGELELAWQCSEGDVLAVTGTNGKTTTASLLYAILGRCRDPLFLVGNIGTSYTGEALNMTEDCVTVAEVSSFQLETIHTFHPRVSAILNLTPDHLNRHHTMEEYIRVKERITENQDETDTCVLNYEDAVLRPFGESLHTQVLFFSSARELERGLYLENGHIVWNDGREVQEICETAALHLVGVHNYENVMAAAGMALAYGVPLKEIREAVQEFQAVEHRIEFVAEKQGVVYYNDSKGTNPDAAIQGIRAMDRPTLLIGGGYDKGSDYADWIRAFDGRVKMLVLIGETKEKIASEAKSCGFDRILLCRTLEEAVAACAQRACPGDAVLLSPACASWDMFPNYEVRGRRFKELVHAL